MSLIQPSRIPALPYEPSTVCRRFERMEAYVMVSPLGLHPAPSNCSFHAREGNSSSIYCENTPSSIQNGGIPYDASAVNLEVTGKIKYDLCFMTTSGDRVHPDTDDTALSARADLASCWLKAPGDTAEERAVWRCSLCQLRRIARRADSRVHMNEFLRPADRKHTCGVSKKHAKDKAPAFLQVSWSAPPSCRLDALPVFNTRYEHISMPSLERVPFDKRVRVRFVLQLAPRSTAIEEKKKGRIIGASIHRMQVLD